MLISDIYAKLGIPPNLQQHMLRVTSVALFIAKNWQGTPLNTELLKTMLLLHDIGNIVRFDFEKHPEFLEDEIIRIDFWKKRQKDFISKYGNDDHEATVAILKELGVSEEIKQKIYQMGYWNVEKVKNSNDWYLKLALYSDLRVGPFGILPLQKRVDDIHARIEQYKNHLEFIGIAQELENQIQANLEISVSKINNNSIIVNENLLKHIV
ncbi:TPA: hypothetical protein DCZ90_02830 [Candidatus Amesbacteria bacterium]|nr:MAG: hypothetical protein UX46_C0007G0093 [Candidatus Amesbacteria bacterium GW2011_GWC1_46_24]HBC72717.1 hypothetical protein [Candidatus Amesbacteria bacterium]